MAGDKNDAVSTSAAPGVLKRPASEVPTAQASRAAQTSAIVQALAPSHPVVPFDAGNTKPGDILRVKVDRRYVAGMEQADHGDSPRPWIRACGNAVPPAFLEAITASMFPIGDVR